MIATVAVTLYPTASPVPDLTGASIRALRLYESCGFEVSRREATYRKPLG